MSHFYGTEYEIWAGFGSVGDLFVMTLCSSVAPMNEIYRRSCCNDVCENALDDGATAAAEAIMEHEAFWSCIMPF